MAETDPNELDKVDHEIRINELKEKAHELTGEEMVSFESDDCPPEIREAFWQNVVNVESGGWTTARKQLEKDGVKLPPPEELDDTQVTTKLWEIIHQLVKHHTFFYNTNHLSDRELYEELWQESLNEEFPDMLVASPTGAYIIDMVGSGSEEDTYIHMKYYANDKDRDDWMKEFPDYQMPPKEKPPYDRDRLLPPLPEGW